MNQTQMPWHATAEDASNAAIIKSTYSPEQVAAHLFPHMTLQSAYQKLNKQLKPDSREVMTADTHIEIARFTGQDDYVQYVNNRTGHEPAVRISPEKQLEEVQTQLAEAVEAFPGLLEQAQDLLSQINQGGKG